MQDNITPEEKLLRLIKNQKKEERPGEKRLSLTSTDLKPKVRPRPYYAWGRYFSSAYLYRLLWVAVIASSAYLLISFLYPLFGLRKIKLPQVKENSLSQSTINASAEVKPYEFYAEAIKGRQLFGGKVIAEAQPLTSGKNLELIKDFSLVGIISGDNPQAVVEDKRNRKTYYLNQGQFLGEFEVEDIKEGKIILNYNGERFELYL